jgi:hypothetical protein
MFRKSRQLRAKNINLQEIIDGSKRNVCVWNYLVNKSTAINLHVAKKVN